MVRVKGLRGLMRCTVCLLFLCLVTEVTRLNRDVLQTDRELLEDAKIVVIWLQSSSLRFSSPQPADVCTLLRNEPIWAYRPFQNQETGRRKRHVWLFRICSTQSNNTLMHNSTWTHTKERAQLHNGLFVLLQGSQQLPEFVLHQEALEEGKPLVKDVCHIVSYSFVLCWLILNNLPSF